MFSNAQVVQNYVSVYTTLNRNRAKKVLLF